MSPQGPEDKAREKIDRLLEAAGWHVCDYGAYDIVAELNVQADRSIAKCSRLRQSILAKAFSSEIWLLAEVSVKQAVA